MPASTATEGAIGIAYRLLNPGQKIRIAVHTPE